MKKTITLIISILILTACKKNDPNFIRITGMCQDGKNVYVDYYINGYTTDKDVNVYILSAGRETLAKKVHPPLTGYGIGQHRDTLSLHGNKCSGLVLIENGDYISYQETDCKMCGK